MNFISSYTYAFLATCKMAQSTAPVSEWTEEAVISFDISRWDHALVKMAGYDTSDYAQARNKFRHAGPKSRPEMVEKAKEVFVQTKRTLLTKLMELRATANQAQSEQLRTASAIVTMTSGDAGKIVDKMMAVTARTASEVAKLGKKHSQLMHQQQEAADQVDRVAELVRRGS